MEVGNGGAGPDTTLDTRVVASETPLTNGTSAPTEGVVSPRLGSYFLRSALYFDKDYGELQSGQNKPRNSLLPVAGSGTQLGGKRTVYDTESYWGISIYLPTNWESESSERRCNFVEVRSFSASWNHMSFGIDGEAGAGNWYIKHDIHATSTRNSGSTEVIYNLGPYEPDKGKWTDFVFRTRWNPFTTSTNAATADTTHGDGRNQVYQGNKGILQVWKTEGAVDGDGNRAFVLTDANIDGGPTGLVPHANYDVTWTWRQYKGGWHTQSTDADGPRWMGFDCLFMGEPVRDGTGFSDVNPGMLSAP